MNLVAVNRARSKPILVDDAALARAALAGEPAAAAAIWDHFSPFVRGKLARLVGSGAELEDLVQEVFLRLFRDLRSLRDPQALRAFVMQLTVFSAMSELRRRRVRKWLRLTDTGNVPELAVGARADSVHHQALRALDRVLDELDPQSRTLFVLRYIEELELREVAALMKMSLATVKRRLLSARERVELRALREPALQSYVIRGEHHVES